MTESFCCRGTRIKEEGFNMGPQIGISMDEKKVVLFLCYHVSDTRLDLINPFKVVQLLFSIRLGDTN